jgi:hypothetical protein
MQGTKLRETLDAEAQIRPFMTYNELLDLIIAECASLSSPALWTSTTLLCVLCCAVLCCAVLCCAVLRCAALCCAVLRCAALCCAVLRCAALRCAALCCAVLCCAVLCCAVLCCAVPPPQRPHPHILCSHTITNLRICPSPASLCHKVVRRTPLMRHTGGRMPS